MCNNMPSKNSGNRPFKRENLVALAILILGLQLPAQAEPIYVLQASGSVPLTRNVACGKKGIHQCGEHYCPDGSIMLWDRHCHAYLNVNLDQRIDTIQNQVVSGLKTISDNQGKSSSPAAMEARMKGHGAGNHRSKKRAGY